MTPRAQTLLVQWSIGPAFAALGAWLVLAPQGEGVPRVPTRAVTPEEIKPGARRTPLADASRALVNGEMRPCVDCHRLFAPSPSGERTPVQHKDIVLRHGMNTRCLNCHDGAERNKLILHDGTLVEFVEAPRLCSQCHGTVYRDWEHGMHGKTMGSWDAAGGRQVRLQCNECHDPHSPAYPPMVPLPGPNTLRMGDQTREREHGHAERHVPLRRWSLPGPGDEPAPPKEHRP